VEREGKGRGQRGLRGMREEKEVYNKRYFGDYLNNACRSSDYKN